MISIRSYVDALLGVGLALALAVAAGQPVPESPVVQPRIDLAATQSANLVMHPQIVQPGSLGAAAQSAMTAKFRPIRKGRKVTLQQWRGKWVTVKTGYQDGRGEVSFVAPTRYNGRIAEYRATAVKSSTLKAISTPKRNTNYWGNADFSDTFSGSALSSNWGHRESDYSAAADRTCSRVEADKAAKMPVVANGTVGVRVLADPDKPTKVTLTGTTVKTCPVTGNTDWRISNSIGTQGNFSFKYGYAAARIKFNPQDGVHGGFWLNSATSTQAEIDVIEWFGNRTNDNTELQSCLYYWVDGVAKKQGGFVKDTWRFGKDWYSKYHVFSVEWTPGRVVYRIDGKETMRLTKGVSSQQMYVILSMFSSDFEYTRISPSGLPQTMNVDWVRVWDRDRFA